jgi:NAD(P)-dependent dehydrogenase (short-subunit alcohol dehydrogenase family)
MSEVETSETGPTSETERDVALVTGSAQPIGAAVARRLAEADWRVYAGARSDADLADLAAAGCETVALDVTDPQEPESVVEDIIADAGHIDAIVAVPASPTLGPIEDVPPRVLRHQFERTVFGLHRTARAILPYMREAESGRIIVVNGMLGRLSVPGAGVQSSAQFAVEGLSDALRAEVASQSIDVSVVQPGPIGGDREEWIPEPADRSAAYADIYQFYEDASAFSGVGATDPTAVATAVHQALTCAEPAPRYPVGRVAEAASWARFLPEAVRDAVFSTLRRLPSLG